MSKKLTNLETNEFNNVMSVFDNIEVRTFEDVRISPYKSYEVNIFGEKNPYSDRDLLFKRTYNKKVKIMREITNVPLNNLVEFDKCEIIFNTHDENTHGLLKDSINKHGLFCPIILWEYYGDKYYILSGYERVRCFKELLIESKLTEYETIPAFILHKEEINDLTAREIYIDSNLSQRKLSPMEISRALSVKCGIKFKEKEKRNDLNIMNDLANDFNMSRSSLYNYKKLEKLIKPLAYLLEQKQITLKNAVKLSGYPEDVQLKILEEIGLNEITNEKMNEVKIEDCNDKKEVERKIRYAKEYKYPFYSSFIVKCVTKFTGKVKDELEKVLGKFPKEYFVTLKKPKVIIG